MSAAEKLKALDAGLPDDWKRISPGEPLIEGPFAAVQLICDLRNALPQIVAVMEAAENYREEFALRGVQTAESGQAWRGLQVALAVLDEALS